MRIPYFGPHTRSLATGVANLAMTACGERAKRRPKTCSASARIVTQWLGTAALLAAICSAPIVVATPAEAFQLVTNDEAALPAGAIPALELRGSPTRRPNVVVVSPQPGAGLIHSPLDLKLRFYAFGGAQIDLDSVVVTYLKQPAIDITQRIAPFITAAGIDVSQAEVPPGTHQFWIELKDKSGRIGAAQFRFQVAK
jgi:hypothetical protein